MLTCTGNVWHISGGPILEYDWSKVSPVGRKHGEESNFYGCPALFYDDFWEVIFGDTNPAALKTFYGTDWGGYVTRPGVNDLLDPPNNYLRAVYGWPTDARLERRTLFGVVSRRCRPLDKGRTSTEKKSWGSLTTPETTLRNLQPSTAGGFEQARCTRYRPGLC